MKAGTGVAGSGRAIRVKNKTARWLTEAFQPPVVVSVQLLISPLVQDGFPATMAYGALAALFVCVLPLLLLLALVRLGKVTDHHVSDRRQRLPVLLMALASILAGLLVLAAAGAPASVIAMVLAVVGGVVVLAAVSPFWKISGHAAAISCSAVVAVLMLGAAWAPLLLLIPTVGWSRVVLRAHTLAQVVAGSLFGGVVMAGIWWLLKLWLVP
ncbi:PAP2 superfamily domain-containing protein [Pseudarthrobacter chlorophenolicus A6]|uniref:PAP2 superfamily domain-containing protein n=1 Tax=Pseudarthrobacter chlorophenolicus (strain ATCC 700700 / DSM 12829 / CIP 107037 / JCM 12360 / KCTC 9906 / NCIMB 13794 / A6) TaxID=452863 RepID=B8H7W5_PSECP|nr:phosphatase PAP2 family protein [Pseudarthrobacter chlorophenolicus]ACL41768.1 PAP2 superfamily domain-containing protein [Pseudarthrobacter chlorophenolicus A6]SDQ58757.1 PAP2 superfamily protein [Pseudarthrobacter chlorophenolicus]